MVTASFARRGDSVEFEIPLTKTATGDLLRPIRSVVGRADQCAALLALLQQRVMAAYDAQFDPRFTNYAAVSQPGNHEAYRELKAGSEERSRDTPAGRHAAELHFRRSMELDPDSWAPRISLANLFWLTGRCPLADFGFGGVSERRNPALAGDQASMHYLLAGCRHDIVGQYEAAVVGLRNAPDAPGAHYVAAFEALRLGRPREAVSILNQMDRSRVPTAWRRWFLYAATIAYHELGEHQKALKEVEQERQYQLRSDPTGKQRTPVHDDPNLDRWEMDERAALGQVDRVNALMDQRMTKSNLEESAGEAMVEAGAELRAHGYREAGMAACGRAATWFGTRPSVEQMTPAFRRSVGGALYCAERWGEAKAVYERLAAEDTSAIRPRIQLAALAVRRSDRAEAERWDNWFQQHEVKPRAVYGRAVIAAQLGDLPRAFALFQQAWDRDAADFDSHADMDLAPLYEYPAFRALVFPKR